MTENLAIDFRMYNRSLRGVRCTLRTICILCTLLLVQTSVLADSLKLRQFDYSRSPAIDITAEIDPDLATRQVEVLELAADRSSVGWAKEVDFVPVASLLDSSVYPYAQPVCNLFFSFAGRSSDIADLSGSLELRHAIEEALSGIQLQAVQLYVLDPAANSMRRCSSPDGVASALLEQALMLEMKKPEGAWNKAKGFFKGSDSFLIDDVGERARVFASKDPKAKRALGHSLVILWADGPDDDVKRVDPEAFRKSGMVVTIGEIVGSSSFAAERARPFCRRTHGEFLSRRDLKLRKGKMDYARIVTTALSKWKNQAENQFLFSAESASLDNVNRCWFDVSIPGSSIRQSVTCRRSEDVVEVGRSKGVRKLQRRFDGLVASSAYEEALELLPRMKKLGGDEAQIFSLKLQVAKAWKKTVLDEANKGRCSVALEQLRSMNDAGMLDRSEQTALREDVYYRAGQWAAVQVRDQNKAIDYLQKWRELTRQSGSYAVQTKKAARVALQLSRYFATDLRKDREFATEINELCKVDRNQAYGEECRGLLRNWVTRNDELFDVSSRVALLDNWDLVLAVLDNENPANVGIRRFMVMATSIEEAADLLDDIRAECVSERQVIPGYVSLNRALVLAGPLAKALEYAVAMRIESAQLIQILNRARVGLNERQAVLYSASEGLADQFLLAENEPVCVTSVRDDDVGYGIRLDPEFNRRLHERGVPVVFEGVSEQRPVHVLLVPVGAESFIRIAFSDRIAPAVENEFKKAKLHVMSEGKSEANAMDICLNVLDLRDAELTTHLGTEVLAQLVSRVGPTVFDRDGGGDVLQGFYNAIPIGVQGFVLLDRLTVEDGRFAPEPILRIPDELPAGVDLERRVSGAAYALWDEPFFEIGIPLREPGAGTVTGILRVGLRSIAR